MPRGNPSTWRQRFTDDVALTKDIVKEECLCYAADASAAFKEDPCPSPLVVCFIIYRVTCFRGLSSGDWDILQ